MEDVKRAIRDVPGFPKEGIIFKDITPILLKPELFKCTVDAFISRFSGQGVDVVAAIEARGFIFGAPVALGLQAGLAIVRKPGKLPYQTRKASYALEYGTDSLEMHIDAIKPGSKVLIIDDLLATGGTAKAVGDLVQALGGSVMGYAFVLELGFLKGRDKLKPTEVTSLIPIDD